MTKAELIAEMADLADMAKTDVSKALDAFIDTVSAALARGEPVTLVGFGTFSVKERAARTGRNPATGAEIQIAACRAPHFAAGKALKQDVN